MWHSRESPTTASCTRPQRRDLVREFVDAFRAEGLRVGLYFSLSDWHHPDYPALADEDRPYRFIAYPRPSRKRGPATSTTSSARSGSC